MSEHSERSVSSRAADAVSPRRPPSAEQAPSDHEAGARDESPSTEQARSERDGESIASTARPAPGRYELGPLVAAFDRRVDGALEPMRGHRLPDAVFVTASRLGDWSMIWHLVGLIRVVAEGRRGLRRSLVFAALLGAESLIVNQGLKRIFNRQRPTIAGDEGLKVRKPLTSSFPSGHSSAAGFAGVVLTDQEGPLSAALWVPMGAVVAVSRVYVRIHHPSDVVAGVAVGVTMGVIGSVVSRRLLHADMLRSPRVALPRVALEGMSDRATALCRP